MKGSVQLLLVVVAAFGQIIISAVLQGASTSLVLVYLIIASMYLKYSQLLWLALLGGTILDLYGEPRRFGFQIGYLLLVAIISKLFIQLEDQNRRLLYCLMLTWGFTLLAELAQLGFLLPNLPQLAWLPLTFHFGFQLFYNTLAVGLLYWLFGYFSDRRAGWRRFDKRGVVH